MNSRIAVRIIFALGLLLASSVALAQQGPQPSGSIAGEWNITFSIQGQTATGTLTLAVEGETLTGTVETHHTGPGKLRDGKFAAKKLSVTCVFEQHDSIALAGELQGEKLVGTFQTEGREGTWEATRTGKTSAAVNRQPHPQS
jgi:hypothetical protein